MNESFDQSVWDGYDDSQYPKGFFVDFEAMECLAHSDAVETLRIRDRRAGGCFLAKCYLDENLLCRTNEGELLKRLSHPGLPRFAAEYRSDGMLCVVREYVEGMKAFAGIQSLRYLSIRRITVDNLAGIEGFSYLEQIGLSDVLSKDLAPLLSLPRLREAYLDEGLREEAENDLSLAAFRIIYF